MSTAAKIPLPPLRDGDRLTRDEFLRRWEAMPELKLAELIDGIVHLPSPVSRIHGSFDIDLGTWARTYSAHTPGCEAYGKPTWLMQQDAPQPDSCLRILPDYGGRSSNEGIYGAGSPELIVEVSYSSHTRDLGSKLRLYERSGVPEYLAAILKEQQIAWFELVEGHYRKISPDQHGILRSRVFPGLWLNEPALWARDFAAVLATLQRGMASPEYAAFGARLADQKREFEAKP
jgi:hypothetical protein